jgi:hypothetical protein
MVIEICEKLKSGAISLDMASAMFKLMGISDEEIENLVK